MKLLNPRMQRIYDLKHKHSENSGKALIDKTTYSIIEELIDITLIQERIIEGLQDKCSRLQDNVHDIIWD